jgi:hypothetical protein
MAQEYQAQEGRIGVVLVKQRPRHRSETGVRSATAGSARASRRRDISAIVPVDSGQLQNASAEALQATRGLVHAASR